MTPEELSRAVREAFAYAARYVSLLVQNNPAGAAGELLSRPDVDAVLADTLDRAREAAAEAVRQEWAAGGGPQHDYLSWLTDDVDRSYEALGRLRTEIRRAHAAVPQRHFEPGASTPGTAPAAESARERAAAVRDAVLHTGSELAQRSRLTLEVASAAAVTFREIEEGTQQAMAGAHVWKQWQCRSWPAPPDARTCHWCRALNGFIVPLHGNFPPGSPADLSGHGRLTRPPRLYRGMLQGPPRHPRCRCRIKILRQLPASPVPSGTGGQGGAAAAAPLHGAAGRTGPPGGLEDPGSLLAAADIRALPEDKYRALAAFLKAATHELGQAVARLRKVLGE